MKNIFNKKSCGLALGAAILSCSQTSLAGSVTDNMDVTATVAAACTIGTISSMDFGTITNLASNNDATSDVTVTCTNGAPYTIASNGGGTGNAVTSEMNDNGKKLEYTLYSNSARTTVWGDGNNGGEVINETGNGTTQTKTIYGRIPSGQNASVGNGYTDTVTVTVSY